MAEFSTLNEALAALLEAEEVAERLPTAAGQQSEYIRGWFSSLESQLRSIELCEPDPAVALGTAHFRKVRGLPALSPRKED